MFIAPTCELCQHGQITFNYSMPRFLHLQAVDNNIYGKLLR